MPLPINRHLVAVFANRGQAEAAVDELWHAGFNKEDIGLASPGERLRQATTATEDTEEKAASGATIGAATGSVLGALAGTLATAAIPGVGPVVVGGLIWGMLGGAAAGAALGTFAGPFIAMGFEEDDVKFFESEFRAGRTLVVVRPKDRQDEAWTILRSHDPIRVDVGDGLQHQSHAFADR